MPVIPPTRPSRVAFLLLVLAFLGSPVPGWADVAGTWQGRLKCQDLRNGNGNGNPIVKFSNSVVAAFTQVQSDGCCHTNGNLVVDDDSNQFCETNHAYSSVTTNADDGLVFFFYNSGETYCTGTAELGKDKKLSFTYVRASVLNGAEQVCQGKLKRSQ
jgi:hypothetical protein